MADLSLLAAMNTNLALRDRVEPMLVRLAIDILGETLLPEDAAQADRTRQAKRRAYAQQVLTDTTVEAAKAQRAAICWRESGLAGIYQTGGAAAVSDGDLEYTLLAVWDALAAA